eukprot:TRINITY_DN67899_c0_g1_i1.p1 TRINITY_DN67899_c0_g1~~TRINITY_DN67899_c0_g1_i1.p1  ORF type:complete len:737 (-),score=119.76 TRINITY_DN67899_c0_g1_i1:55-2265(-)
MADKVAAAVAAAMAEPLKASATANDPMASSSPSRLSSPIAQNSAGHGAVTVIAPLKPLRRSAAASARDITAPASVVATASAAAAGTAARIRAAVAGCPTSRTPLQASAVLSDSPPRSTSTAPVAATDSKPLRRLTVCVRLHPPVFFGEGCIVARLGHTGEGGRVVEPRMITSWPYEACLSGLRADSLLRLSVFSSPTAATSQGCEMLRRPRQFANVFVPLQRVIEKGMSLSFCTLWLAVQELTEDATEEEVYDPETSFALSLQRGQQLETPKLGVSLKLSDEEASEDDRLSMFSVVDMYADALALVYQKAESALAQRSAKVSSLFDKVDAQEMRESERVEQVREEHQLELAAMRGTLEERQQKLDKLANELHTATLAGRAHQRRIARLQEEVGLAATARHCPSFEGSPLPRSPSVSGCTGGGRDWIDIDCASAGTVVSSEFASSLQRAERVAERERCRARALEKELRETRQYLDEALAERHQEAEAPAPEQKQLVGDAGPAAAYAETIVQLQREIGGLAKSRSDARRRTTLLEQQLLEEKRRVHELERRLDSEEKTHCAPFGAIRGKPLQETLRGDEPSAVVGCRDTGVAALLRQQRDENLDLHEELRRLRAEVCRARADLAPVRDENVRLTTEIRALLRSRLSQAESTLANRQQRPGGRSPIPQESARRTPRTAQSARTRIRSIPSSTLHTESNEKLDWFGNPRATSVPISDSSLDPPQVQERALRRGQRSRTML